MADPRRGDGRGTSESGFVAVPGGSIYFESQGAGHPLVLLHAGVANLRMWDFQVDRFAERHRVIRYDTRGYGRTESEHVEFSNRADLAAIMDHCLAASAFVLGASRGGGIALDFALEYPRRVDALIVAAGGISGYRPPAATERQSIWDEAERMWKAHDWERLSDFETRWWVDGPEQPPDRVDAALRERVHDWILSTYRAEKEEGIPIQLEPPAVGRLAELEVPTLVLLGELDDPATNDSCRRLAGEITGARLETFPTAHMINLEEPDRFAATVMSFLASAEGTTRSA